MVEAKEGGTERVRVPWLTLPPPEVMAPELEERMGTLAAQPEVVKVWSVEVA